MLCYAMLCCAYTGDIYIDIDRDIDMTHRETNCSLQRQFIDRETDRDRRLSCLSCFISLTYILPLLLPLQ
jgi:hypothetical protein